MTQTEKVALAVGGAVIIAAVIVGVGVWWIARCASRIPKTARIENKREN